MKVFRAVGILILVVALCVVADRITSPEQPQSQQVAAVLAARSALANASSPQDLPEAYVSERLGAYGHEVPAVFAEEAFMIDEAAQTYVSADGRTLCFYTNKSADELHAFVLQVLEEKGWQRSEIGVEKKDVLTKSEGSLHWMLVEIWPAQQGSMVIVTQEGVAP